MPMKIPSPPNGMRRLPSQCTRCSGAAKSAAVSLVISTVSKLPNQPGSLKFQSSVSEYNSPPGCYSAFSKDCGLLLSRTDHKSYRCRACSRHVREEGLG